MSIGKRYVQVPNLVFLLGNEERVGGLVRGACSGRFSFAAGR